MSEFAILNQPPKKLVINDADGNAMVTICLDDGHMLFGSTYRPEAAARLFWAALICDYRQYLAWKDKQ